MKGLHFREKPQPEDTYVERKKKGKAEEESSSSEMKKA